MEVGLIFDKRGGPVYWHLPQGRSQVYLPDSRQLWHVLWTCHQEGLLGGFAHTHPWSGEASPSYTDVTTFAAVEAGLGTRLVWPIVTFSEVKYFQWLGPDRLDYGLMEVRRFRINKELIEELRKQSR
jgi:hypothetical protein